jgi:monoamine oxidase
VIVDEFREFVSIMRADLRRLSREITALSHTAYDVVLDQTSLAAYLEGGNSAGAAAGTIAKAAISEAYLAEYGLEPDEQSCLNFLMFIHADRRSKFTPFGISSDERYHLVDGNDGIAEGLTQSLSQVVQLEMRLVAVRRRANGAIELTFDTPSGPVVRAHDVVVLAIPFTILRTVALDVSLSVPAAQRSAINLLGYGTNAKMMLGFGGRPWVAQGSSGTAYSDLTNHQLTWETNRARASAARGVLTDYSSGDRGQSLNQGTVQGQAAAFLADLDVVFPGAAAVASRRADGTLVAHLEHWPSNPLTLGSYTCYRPGQFTSIAGLEGLAVDNLHFAGEHTNSFYVWQGFMEGAALSGLDVAAAILRVAKQS